MANFGDFAPQKLCDKRTVNRSETRTTLILDRYTYTSPETKEAGASAAPASDVL